MPCWRLATFRPAIEPSKPRIELRMPKSSMGVFDCSSSSAAPAPWEPLQTLHPVDSLANSSCHSSSFLSPHCAVAEFAPTTVGSGNSGTLIPEPTRAHKLECRRRLSPVSSPILRNDRRPKRQRFRAARADRLSAAHSVFERKRC